MRTRNKRYVSKQDLKKTNIKERKMEQQMKRMSVKKWMRLRLSRLDGALNNLVWGCN